MNNEVPVGAPRRISLQRSVIVVLAAALLAILGLGIPSAAGAATNHNPRGHLDSVRSGEGQFGPQLRFEGWAADDDAPGFSLTMNYYFGAPYGSPGSRFGGSAKANLSRPDVARAFPSLGAAHGYDVVVTASKTSSGQVYLYAVNTGPGASILVGHALLSERAPIGHLDSAMSSKAGQIALRGWTADQDIPTKSLQVDVYLGGPFGHAYKSLALTANGNRPDVAKALPGFGPNHGFAASISARAGTYPVCVYAINADMYGNATLLGCPMLTVH